MSPENGVLSSVRLFPFSRARFARLTRGFLLIASLGLSGLRADVIDYFADATLARTTIDIDVLKKQPATLPQIFALVEQQTRLKFTYLDNQLPTDRPVALEARGAVTLARLFTDLSTMLEVVFQRRGQRVVVRPRWQEDRVTDRPASAFSASASTTSNHATGNRP